jgi:hypothetical protein
MGNRRKYQLMIVRFLKEITHHASQIEERLQSLDNDNVDRSVIVGDII